MGDEGNASLWTTARHEAGHAVAALHYDCPIAHASIEREGRSLGTTRIGCEVLRDAIVLFCGPLAEKDDWEDCPGRNVSVDVYGTDEEGLRYLALKFGDLSACVGEAALFISQRPVQEQINLVAQALLERTTLTADEIRAVSGFSCRLCSPEWV